MIHSPGGLRASGGLCIPGLLAAGDLLALTAPLGSDAVVWQLVVLVALVVGSDVRQLLDALQVVLQVAVAVQHGRVEHRVDLQSIVEDEIWVSELVAQQVLVLACSEGGEQWVSLCVRLGRSFGISKMKFNSNSTIQELPFE